MSAMSEDVGLAADPSPWATEQWWAQRRRRYNVALLIAGILGFICYAAAVQLCINLKAPGDWEITIFSTFFQGLGYLVMMGVANLCYYLGPQSERLLHPVNIARYRKITFQLGFWFSVLLPRLLLFFSCPAPSIAEKRSASFWS
jgi:hypothetical protein